MSNSPVGLTPPIASYQSALLAVLEAADLIATSNGSRDAAASAETRAAAADPGRASAGAPEGAAAL